MIGAFPMATRRTLFDEMQPLVTSFEGHPWNWAAAEVVDRHPQRNAGSRWNAGKDLSFVPLRPERVVEVRYDYMEGERFRHTAQFVRWRPDRIARVVHLRPAGPSGPASTSPTCSGPSGSGLMSISVSSRCRIGTLMR